MLSQQYGKKRRWSDNWLDPNLTKTEPRIFLGGDMNLRVDDEAAEKGALKK
jgi:hypothetical protein